MALGFFARSILNAVTFKAAFGTGKTKKYGYLIPTKTIESQSRRQKCNKSRLYQMIDERKLNGEDVME